MQVKSIAECSLGAFCNTFDLHKTYHLSLRPLFCLFFEWPFYTSFTVALKIGVCSHYQIVHAFKHTKYHISLKIRSVCDFFAIFFLLQPKQILWVLKKGTLCDGSFEHSKHIYLNWWIRINTEFYEKRKEKKTASLDQYYIKFNYWKILILTSLIILVSSRENLILLHAISKGIGQAKQNIFVSNCDYFLIHQFKHVFWVLKRTHNICFHWEIRK